MEKGTNYNTKSVLDYIGLERMSEIESYIDIILKEDFMSFSNEEELNRTFSSYINNLLTSLSNDEISKILRYTGIDFRRVNPILRGYWDYDKSGALTDEVKKDALALAREINKIILKRAYSLGFNFKTYRGTSIRSFYSYGITSLEELVLLKDKYLYELGFTSTSLLPETSFFARKPEWGDLCNIEIEYLIPKDSCDGIALLSDNLSYSNSQNEFLINDGTLFKVIDIAVDKENNCAHIKMILVPEKVWNPLDYEMERQNLEK